MPDSPQQVFAQYQDWALRLAARAARRLPRCVQLAEVQSAALEGLWDASGRWDGQRRFRTFAQWRIMGAINDYLRSLQPASQRRQAVPRLRAHRLEDLLELSNALAPLALDEEEERDRLLCLLPERSQRVLRQWSQGQRLKDIGRVWGVSESRISQIVSESLAKLRTYWTRHKTALEDLS